MTAFTWAWLLWLASFGVIEGIAVRNKKRGDTLSEHVWEWFSVRKHGKAKTIRRVFLLGFMAWLTVHFTTGGTWV